MNGGGASDEFFDLTGSMKSMVVRTRCSSMPSAETLRKPAGSTRVTRPLDRRSAPAVDPDERTGFNPRCIG